MKIRAARDFRYSIARPEMNVFPLRLAKPAAVMAMIAVFSLSGCGRRGLPELPPEADAKQAIAPKGPEIAPYSEVVEPTRRPQKVIPPKDPFILDPLL